MHVHKKQFSGVPSRGPKWENKTYKLKRSISYLQLNFEFPLFSHIFLSLVISGGSDEEEGKFDHLRPIISLKLKVVGERAEKS